MDDMQLPPPMADAGMPPRGPMQMAKAQAEPDGDEMNGGEVCIPLKALTQPDERDQMTTPEVGDSGTMTVDYTVTRIEGDNAYVKANSVNGTAIGDDENEVPQIDGAPEGTGDQAEMQDEGASLRDEAAQM